MSLNFPAGDIDDKTFVLISADPLELDHNPPGH